MRWVLNCHEMDNSVDGWIYLPKIRTSEPRPPSALGDEVLLRSLSRSRSASSSSRFFLNRVSVMGRKKVQSNPYCLQC